jgi:DNA topoisomerase-3
MSLSRAESIKYRTGINVGRVQSPTLYFVVKRYLEVQNFKVTNYYTFDADFFEGFHAFWNKDTDGKFSPSFKDSEGRLLDAAAAKAKAQEILQGKTGTITALDKQKKATDRPQLYDITELQRDANRKYGYTAAVTLATAQALYETQKVLSYPRTDSRYITTDLQPYMAERVKAVGTLGKYKTACGKLSTEGLNIDKKIVDDSKVTDHHALIPTEKIENFDFKKLIPTPEEKKKGVTAETMQNVLDLVLCRLIVAFSKAFLYEQTTINVTFPNGFVFSASGKKPISLGWKAVQDALNGKEEDSDDADEADAEQIFPNIAKGQTVTVRGCAVVPKKTTPPKLHTEATLLSAMENAGASIENGAILKGKGIGTQATRAEIIKKLFDTQYVETEKKGKTNYIKPTAKGLSIIRVLPPDLYSPKITADWETKIAAIAEGKSSEADFMQAFKTFINAKVCEVKENETGIVFKKEREVFGVCPWCESDVVMYQRKDDKGKVTSHSYYCTDKCGFNLENTDDTFISRLGRKLTDAEAKKFVAKGFLTLSCKKKSGDGTYMGEFTFKSRESNGKTYCNVMCEPVRAKK